MRQSPAFETLKTPERAPDLDALIVLGAVMDWDAKRGQWNFPTIVDRYAGKLVMGKARAIAASEVAKRAPAILVTGGSDTHPETGEVHSRAVELARLISGRYRVDQSKVVIMGEADSSHTMGNVENVVAYLKGHENLLTHKKIGILSPRFQAERAKLMFDAEPYFTERGITIEWILVEDVLVARNPAYKAWVDNIYATPEAELNAKLEQQGIQDLESGKYRPKS